MAHRRRVAYVGWLNHSNLGDDAMFAALRSSLRPLHLAEVPPKAVRMLERTSSRRLLDGIMLGGGTLIGQRTYRDALTQLLAAQPLAVPFMLGSGVDDPAADTARVPDARDELLRWTEVLERFPAVTVRGPRSRELLSDVGIDARVVGDPALLLARPRSSRPPERVLGINVSLSAPVRGGRPGDVLEAVRGMASAMATRGWRFRLFSMWPADEPALEELRRDLPEGTQVIREYRDVDAVLDALAGCTAFVGLKLHSVVLATAVGVPSLMLAYHPKCDDYQASLGLERYSITTDGIDANELTNALEALLAEAEDVERHTVARVIELRASLNEEATSIVTRLTAARDESVGRRG